MVKLTAHRSRVREEAATQGSMEGHLKQQVTTRLHNLDKVREDQQHLVPKAKLQSRSDLHRDHPKSHSLNLHKHLQRWTTTYFKWICNNSWRLTAVSKARDSKMVNSLLRKSQWPIVSVSNWSHRQKWWWPRKQLKHRADKHQRDDDKIKEQPKAVLMFRSIRRDKKLLKLAVMPPWVNILIPMWLMMAKIWRPENQCWQIMDKGNWSITSWVRLLHKPNHDLNHQKHKPMSKPTTSSPGLFVHVHQSARVQMFQFQKWPRTLSHQTKHHQTKESLSSK